MSLQHALEVCSFIIGELPVGVSNVEQQDTGSQMQRVDRWCLAGGRLGVNRSCAE